MIAQTKKVTYASSLDKPKLFISSTLSLDVPWLYIHIILDNQHHLYHPSIQTISIHLSLSASRSVATILRAVHFVYRQVCARRSHDNIAFTQWSKNGFFAPFEKN